MLKKTHKAKQIYDIIAFFSARIQYHFLIIVYDSK